MPAATRPRRRCLRGRRTLAWRCRGMAASNKHGALRARVRAALESQGVRLHGFEIDRSSARVGIENTAYSQTAQAVGRTARVLSRLLPAEVAHFDITLVAGGMPVTELRIGRDDMETLEHDLEGSWKSFARARIATPHRRCRHPRTGALSAARLGHQALSQPQLL